MSSYDNTVTTSYEWNQNCSNSLYLYDASEFTPHVVTTIIETGVMILQGFKRLDKLPPTIYWTKVAKQIHPEASDFYK